VYLGSGWLLYSGPLGSARRHRHHALQVVVSRAGSIALTDGEGRSTEGAAVCVGADVAHAMPAGVASSYLLYVDADSVAAHRVALLSPLRGVPAASAEVASVLEYAEPSSLDGARDVARSLLSMLAGEIERGAGPRDRAVRSALAAIPGLIAERGRRLRLADVAAAGNRSADRFARTFAEQVGLSVPAYLRWARLRFVARSLAAGRSLTAAAQEAGFSDSAHLSRVFRESFGMTPSALSTGARWIVGDAEL